MDVCGIDPGLERTGFAVLRVDGRTTTILDAGFFKTNPRDDLAVRLAHMQVDIEQVLDRWSPGRVGVEQLYAHYKHPRTAILMGHARGVFLAAAARRDIPVDSYNPTEVKRFLTGNGRASKVQMQRAIKATLGLDYIPEPNDVADAMAVAVCCANSQTRGRVEASLR
jgi:crossover junction endodeoxyribonuclease RuvC